MTEEKNYEEKSCNCFCKSKWFKKFLIVTFGTFIGAFLALCLFSAINKPPMPPIPPMHPAMHHPGMHKECPCWHHYKNSRPKAHPPVIPQAPEPPIQVR